MSTEVNIKLYSIERCGYYKRKSINAEFCNATETFRQLFDWSQNVTIQESSTFDPPEDSSVLKQYLLGIERAESGDYYLSLWNQVPTTDENAVAAVSANSTHGQPEFEFQDFTEGYIPGFATYFWISPEENRFATIRFERSINGQKGFSYFMSGFLKTFTTFVQREVDYDKNLVTVVGYDQEEKDLFVRFRARSLRNNGPIDYIRRNLSHVSKVISKSLIIPGQQERESLYRSLLNFIACGSRKPITDEFAVKYELPIELTEADFNSMYEHWRTEDDKREDVGFKIGSETYWFGHEVQKTDINLNISRVNQELYNLTEIMNEIERNKETILRECSHEMV